jgi:hypothetical protein
MKRFKRTLVAIAILSLVAAGGVAASRWPANAPPRSAPSVLPLAPRAAGITRIAVIGDFGTGSSAAADVAALVTSWQPDLIATTGDNNYPAGAADTIDTNIGRGYHTFIAPYAGSYGQGSAVNRFFPVLGNHDWRTTAGDPPQPAPYLDFFTLPAGPGHERYYDIVTGDVHLFMLDSDPHEPDGITSTSVQADWLREVLAASTAPWKLVFLHHPPFSSSAVHGSTPALQWPFRAWGATAFAGHDHTYERLLIDGIPYFVNGLGGAGLYGMGDPMAGSMFRYNADHGAMLLEANAESILFRLFDRTGGEQDRYQMFSADPLPNLARVPAWRTVERTIALAAGDAEENRTSGNVALTGTALSLGESAESGAGTVVALRFAALPLPASALITRAYLEFVTQTGQSHSSSLTFAAEAQPSPLPFSDATGDLSRRTPTATTVEWTTIPAWPTLGRRHRSPDLAALLQEIIALPGWDAGQPVNILVTGTGLRTAAAFDSSPAAAPRLHIEYVDRLFLPVTQKAPGQTIPPGR